MEYYHEAERGINECTRVAAEFMEYLPKGLILYRSWKFECCFPGAASFQPIDNK